MAQAGVKIAALKQMALSRTARDSFTLFSGNLFSAGLTLIAVIFISRKLGPANFGIFATFSAIVTVALGLTDFGLGTTAIKTISHYLKKDPRQAQITMKVIFKLELLLGLLVGLFGLLFSDVVASALGGEHLRQAVRLAFLAGMFISAAAYVQAFLNAHRQFRKTSFYIVAIALFKLGGVLVLLLTGNLTLSSVLWLYVANGFVMFVLGYLVSPKGFTVPAKPQEQKKAFWEIFHFSKWILVSFVATTLISRFDIFLLSRLKGPEAVGFYAAAMQLASIMPLVIGAISSVLLPQFSAATGKELTSMIKRSLLGSVGLVLLFLPVLLFSGFIINAVFGARFADSLLPFKIIFLGYLVTLIINPVGQALYALSRTKALAALNIAQMFVALPLNLLLIPRLGTTGAAISFVVMNFVGGVIATFFLWKSTRGSSSITLKNVSD